MKEKLDIWEEVWRDDQNFGKNTITKHIDSECDRQLFLSLAKENPQWRDPLEKLEKPRRPKRTIKFILKLGHYYEQLIYKQFLKNPKVKYAKNRNKKKIKKTPVVKTILKKTMLENYYSEMKKNKVPKIILLENEFKTPKKLQFHIFKQKNKGDPVPVKFSAQRPDILIISNLILNNKNSDNNNNNNTNNSNNNKEFFELKPDGIIRKVPSNELNQRYALNVIDIKNIDEENVGKKQFIEIFYYLINLSYFIHENSLTDKFFVNIDGNGIFPRYSKLEIQTVKSINDLVEKNIEIHWKEIKRIYYRAIRTIQKLWKNAPCSHKDISLNIQPKCGYCRYLEDCLVSLGKDSVTDPKDWSLDLIPYTSNSIKEQLKSEGFSTIGDVADKIGNITIGSTPEPLYAEIPILKIKAKALKENRTIIPKSDNIHTYAIPKFTDLTLTLAIETDPANEVVFGYSLYMFFMISSKSPVYLLFENWWNVWSDAIKKTKTSRTISVELQNVGFLGNIKVPLDVIKQFRKIVFRLKNKLKIKLRGNLNKNGKKYKTTTIHYQCSNINQDFADPLAETDVAKKMIDDLHDIFTISNIMEYYIQIIKTYKTMKGNRDWVIKPKMSVFYWGEDQLEHLQDMIQRTLKNLMKKKKVLKKIKTILLWFSPSDSEVTHPYQHKKIYNLQKFIETVIGYPNIINYTWHEIASQIYNWEFQENFWILHYNYMDYNEWHRFLEAEKSKEKKIEKKIRYQLMLKTYNINRLRIKFQHDARGTISNNSRPFSINKFMEKDFPNTYHIIANVWFFYSKLSGTMQEYEAEYFRTMFPDFSIGKLEAAEISKFKEIPTSKKFYYILEIIGLSSNMKISEGDYVLLIPDELRDMSIGNWSRIWVVIIDKMIWNSKIQGYTVITKETKEDFEKNYVYEVKNPKKKPIWYLYKTSNDPWTKKLYGLKVGGLFTRWNFGGSWLGERLAYQWNIKSKISLNPPKSLKFYTPEIILYAPKLLQKQTNKKINRNIISNILPKPDSSQREAILNALENIIFAIQGPPGTGKSQTIAALVDEFIQRRRKNEQNSRILITAFSYAAIRVMIDKIRKSKNKSKSSSISSQIQQVFLRSISQDPVPNIKNLKDIDDLVRNQHGSWRWNGKPKIVTTNHPLEEVLEKDFIIYGNAHQLFRLTERVRPNFVFDLIIVDEASQLPTDYFMSSLQFVKKQVYNLVLNGVQVKKLQIPDKSSEKISEEDLTKIVIVGDFNQLPPVQPVDPPKDLKIILDSLFSYYVKEHKIDSTQLKVNYRSNQDIVDFTSLLGIYKGLNAYHLNADKHLGGKIDKIKIDWVKEVLDPKKNVSTLIHHSEYEIAVSTIEAKIVSELALGYYKMLNITTKTKEDQFWQEYIGVVSPHNAQGRLIVHRIFESMTQKGNRLTNLDNDELMKNLINTIYSVEKFQGSDRNLIIGSVGISDTDQLSAEDEFIFNLNRFNVLTSRAKEKIVIVCSESYLDFIPKDREIMNQAYQSHRYALEFCNEEKTLLIKNHNQKMDYLYLRWKNSQNQNQIKKPYSSFSISGKIIDNKFQIDFLSNILMKKAIQKLPAEFERKQIFTDANSEKWQFLLKDINKLSNFIPIPQNILKDLKRKKNEGVLEKSKNDKEKKSKKGKDKKVIKLKKKAKTVKKKSKKKVKNLNINFGDKDEKPLF